MSNNTIKCRITEMSNNILSQVIQEIKAALGRLFSIQLNEATDVSNLAQLLVYVQYIKDDKMKDEFLFCKPQGLLIFSVYLTIFLSSIL